MKCFRISYKEFCISNLPIHAPFRQMHCYISTDFFYDLDGFLNTFINIKGLLTCATIRV